MLVWLELSGLHQKVASSSLCTATTIRSSRPIDGQVNLALRSGQQSAQLANVRGWPNASCSRYRADPYWLAADSALVTNGDDKEN